MPRKSAVPRYTLHKPSGQGRARHQGRDIYFGVYEAPSSHEKYARFVAELAVTSSPRPEETAFAVADPELPVAEMILRFLRHAQGYYGVVSKELVSLAGALKPVNLLYGTLRAGQFGPLALKAVQQHMIDQQKLCRNEINRRLGRIKRAFKWAVSEQLIPPSVFQGLQAVTGIRRGRSNALERPAVEPVSTDVVRATLPFLAPPVAAICELQVLTGMRPSEVVRMRGCEIDRTGDIWVYSPSCHKTQYLGFQKQVPLGPRAQEILRPFLNRLPEAFLFSPAEAEVWRNGQRAISRRPDRKRKVYPCELRARARRKATAQLRTRKRPFQESYTADSYRRAITYGLRKARKMGVDLPHWFPYQIRHTHGTEVRRMFGLEAAQVALGHASADVTQIYAERNMALATRIANEIG